MKRRNFVTAILAALGVGEPGMAFRPSEDVPVSTPTPPPPDVYGKSLMEEYEPEVRRQNRLRSVDMDRLFALHIEEHRQLLLKKRV